MSITKNDVLHLEKLLSAIKNPYPRFVECAMSSMGDLSEENFFHLIKWLESDPDLTTDDIVKFLYNNTPDESEYDEDEEYIDNYVDE